MTAAIIADALKTADDIVPPAETPTLALERRFEVHRAAMRLLAERAEAAEVRAKVLRATIIEAVNGFKMAEEADDPGRSNDFLNETIVDFRKAAAKEVG